MFCCFFTRTFLSSPNSSPTIFTQICHSVGVYYDNLQSLNPSIFQSFHNYLHTNLSLRRSLMQQAFHTPYLSPLQRKDEIRVIRLIRVPFLSSSTSIFTQICHSIGVSYSNLPTIILNHLHTNLSIRRSLLRQSFNP